MFALHSWYSWWEIRCVHKISEVILYNLTTMHFSVYLKNLYITFMYLLLHHLLLVWYGFTLWSRSEHCSYQAVLYIQPSFMSELDDQIPTAFGMFVFLLDLFFHLLIMSWFAYDCLRTCVLFSFPEYQLIWKAIVQIWIDRIIDLYQKIWSCTDSSNGSLGGVIPRGLVFESGIKRYLWFAGECRYPGFTLYWLVQRAML
jgi:hypothetical protein